ncbi:hypothetical protein AB0K60_00020 [Thermopolyspora sp. NPDC052614]|uniref:hypothetical protein n=1 Tax=Thermopolyspora sp. NPDC052614 TaxID=3155682 RepID=UPI00341B2A46
MAVPQIQRARAFGVARAIRVPVVLDIVVGLLIALAIPLAIVTIPNTVSVVGDLLPPEVSRAAMIRAHGMSLPAMLLTVPLAVLAARRFHAAPLLLAGLALLAAAEAAGGFAATPLVAGVLRGLHGVGAGLLMPATLLAAWERQGGARRALLALWAGALTASMLTAQALALWPLDQATSWRVTLQPYPLITGLALTIGAVYLVLWLVSGESRATRPTVIAGGRLLSAVAPTAGIAALALGTTFDWLAALTLAAAGVSVIMLFALGLLGAPDGVSGRVLAIVMTIAGIVVLPTAAQTTYVELGGVGGPGLLGLWLPFTIAVVLALAVPVLAGRMRSRAAGGSADASVYASVDASGNRGRTGSHDDGDSEPSGVVRTPKVRVGWDDPGAAGEARGFRGSEVLSANLVRAGLAALVVGLAAIRVLVPTADGIILTVPFTLVAVGVAVSLAAALWAGSAGAALFALTLCFPAVLAGFLLGTGMQIARVRALEELPNPTARALVDGFVATLHAWALIGGFTVVAGLVLTAILLRRKEDGLSGAVQTGPTREKRAESDRESAAMSDPGTAPVGLVPDRRVHSTGTMDVLVARGEPVHGRRPVVPPPSPSPEASLGSFGGGGRLDRLGEVRGGEPDGEGTGEIDRKRRDEGTS